MDTQTHAVKTFSHINVQNVDRVHIGDNFTYDTSYSKSQRRKETLKWLSPTDYSEDNNNFTRQLQKHTGQWLFSSIEFQTWYAAKNKTLFCTGNPGAGKTMLTASVIDYIANQPDLWGSGNVGVAFIYCNFRRAEEQSPVQILENILKQLGNSSDENKKSSPYKVIAGLYEHYHRKPNRPSFEEVSMALRTILSSKYYSRSFIIIDALDEYRMSTCRDRRRLLTELYKIQAETGTNLFITSRSIGEFQDVFKESEDILNVRIPGHTSDLDAYLDEHVPDLSRYVSGSPETQRYIKKTIIEAVNGIFLLARLYLESLEGVESSKEISRVLERLSSGSELYDAAYDETMRKIQFQAQQLRERALKVLSWISCALRPLTTLELRHALAAENSSGEIPQDRYLLEVEDLVSVCHGLVVVNDENLSIGFMHYTTQEYFEKSQGKWFPDAQRNITATCITYLSCQALENGVSEYHRERLRLYPFYGYSAQHWGDHSRAVWEGPDGDVERQVVRFLQNESLAAAACKAIETDSEDFQWIFDKFHLSVGFFQALHLASYFGLGEAALALMEARQANLDIDPKLFSPTPLHWAVLREHEEAVELLAAARSYELNCTYALRGATPLALAARRGSEQLLQRILALKGVDPNTKDWGGRTPLHWGVIEKNEGIVELLLSAKVLDPSWGERVQQVFTVKRVDPNCKDAKGRTPLHHAVSLRFDAIVRQLLNAGDVDPNLGDKKGRRPLHYAVINRDESILQYLLSSGGVDPNTKDIKGRTPLHLAVLYGEQKLVQKLLDTKGTRPNAKDGMHRTPLQYAEQMGLEEISRQLKETKVAGAGSRSMRIATQSPLEKLGKGVSQRFRPRKGTESDSKGLALRASGLSEDSDSDTDSDSAAHLIKFFGKLVVENPRLLKLALE